MFSFLAFVYAVLHGEQRDAGVSRPQSLHGDGFFFFHSHRWVEQRPREWTH